MNHEEALYKPDQIIKDAANDWELACILNDSPILTKLMNDVDMDIIWTIVTKDLPPLIRQLIRILQEEQG